MLVLWDVLAEYFNETLGIGIGRIESIKNEIEDLPIENFPSIKFFICGRKKEAIDYKGPREKDAIVSFVKEHST